MINFRMLKLSDKGIWLGAAFLIFAGLLMILSTTFSLQQKAGGDPFLFFRRQFFSFLVGLIFMGLASYVDYHRLKAFAVPLYVIMIVSLMILLFTGQTIQGAQRWLSIGFLSFQPSEIAKLFLIIVLAALISSQRKFNIPLVLFISGIPFLMVFFQPDLGTSLVFLVVTLGIIFYIRPSFRFLVILLTPFISLVLYKFFYIWLIYLFLLWLILYFSREKVLAILLIILLNIGVGVGFPYMWNMLKDYQKMRIVAFLNPNIDPQGMGYHTLQSKIAVGAGGLFGRGYLRGSQTQLHFIPEQHSDFVFSAVAEEFGFLGIMIVMSVVLFLIWRFLSLADEVEDKFASILLIGMAVMFAFHFFVSIGMTLGLLPVVGIPFPFLSFGGTSLVVNMTAIGIIQSIAMRRRKIIF